MDRTERITPIARIFRIIPALLCALLFLSAFSSCFAGVGNTPAPSGVREGVSYFYLEDEALLILAGKKEIAADHPVFSMDFISGVRFLLFGYGVTQSDAAVFDRMDALETVFYTEEEGDFAAGRYLSAQQIEETLFLPSGHILGHCPESSGGKCLLCGRNCGYFFENLLCGMTIDGKVVTGAVVQSEGSRRVFDENGRLQCEGFTTLYGQTRYFENGRMTVGTKDIDGERCSFTSEGVLSSRKALDGSLPFTLLIPALVSLPVGGAIVFLIVRFYRKKASAESP